MAKDFDENGIVLPDSPSKRRKGLKKERKYLSIDRKSMCILLTVFLIALPFLMDWLYGCGILHRIPHNFSTQDWISIIFSYIPSVILGILSIYLAYLAFEKDRELERIQNRNRFILPEEAVLYVFDDRKENGEEDLYKRITDELREAQRGSDLLMDFCKIHKIYLFKYFVKDMKNIQVNSIQITSFQWKIRDKLVVEVTDPERIKDRIYIPDNRFCGGVYEGEILFLIDDTPDVQKEVSACMNNGIRWNQKYKYSYIVLTVSIKDEEQEKFDLAFWFKMKSVDLKENMIRSVKEIYYVG